MSDRGEKDGQQPTRVSITQHHEQNRQSQDDSTESIVSPENNAEGGLEGWLNVLGSVLVYFTTFGFINSFGFFQSYYEKGFLSSYQPAVIAFIGTLQISLLYVMSPVAGSLFDAYGLKYLYAGAGLGCSLSLVLLSFSQPGQIWAPFLTQGLLFGLCSAFGVQPALSVVGQYFQKRRALAMGIVAAGSSVGGVAFPFLFSGLIPVLGLGWTLRLSALICIICYTVAILVSNSRQPPQALKSVRELLDFGGYRDLRYSVLAVGTFIGSLGLYVPYYYIESYALTLRPGMENPSGIVSALLPLINASSLFGRILGGQAADKLGRLNVLWPMTGTCGILCLLFWIFATNIAEAVAFSILYGFCSGIFISVTPAVVGEISPKDKLGARIGAFFGLTAVATLAGSPAAGALIQDSSRRTGYLPLIAFSGASLLLGGLLQGWTQILIKRNRSH
ncbi:major facilitator superfamily domain-containing protein [Nemania abortiva]|nr:major facilitator superfamily domain-containing protein [Nemania abortiva]